MTPDAMPKLPPCPFCGHAHIEYYVEDGDCRGGFWATVCCDDCGGSYGGDEFKIRQDAIDDAIKGWGNRIISRDCAEAEGAN